MADVFLSYASDDRNKAEMLVNALKRAGLEVAWDDRIGLDAIKNELETYIQKSSCVLVCLSKAAIGSRWVQWEVGLKPDRTYGCVLDNTEPKHFPLKIEEKHVVSLAKWDGNWNDRAIARIIAQMWLVRAGTLGTPLKNTEQKELAGKTKIGTFIESARNFTINNN